MFLFFDIYISICKQPDLEENHCRLALATSANGIRDRRVEKGPMSNSIRALCFPEGLSGITFCWSSAVMNCSQPGGYYPVSPNCFYREDIFCNSQLWPGSFFLFYCFALSCLTIISDDKWLAVVLLSCDLVAGVNGAFISHLFLMQN